MHYLLEYSSIPEPMCILIIFHKNNTAEKIHYTINIYITQGYNYNLSLRAKSFSFELQMSQLLALFIRHLHNLIFTHILSRWYRLVHMSHICQVDFPFPVKVNHPLLICILVSSKLLPARNNGNSLLQKNKTKVTTIYSIILYIGIT